MDGGCDRKRSFSAREAADVAAPAITLMAAQLSVPCWAADLCGGGGQTGGVHNGRTGGVQLYSKNTATPPF